MTGIRSGLKACFLKSTFMVPEKYCASCQRREAIERTCPAATLTKHTYGQHSQLCKKVQEAAPQCQWQPTAVYMNLNPSLMEEHQARLILDITHISLLPTLPALQEFSATKSHFRRMEKKSFFFPTISHLLNCFQGSLCWGATCVSFLML